MISVPQCAGVLCPRNKIQSRTHRAPGNHRERPVQVAGVCASVHRNAGSEGGLQEPGRAGWTGRDGGEGRSERGRGAGERRQVEQRGPPARHGQRGGRAGDASLTRPTGARRSVRPGLRAPGSERGGQAGGGARAGGGGQRNEGRGPVWLVLSTCPSVTWQPRVPGSCYPIPPAVLVPIGAAE